MKSPITLYSWLFQGPPFDNRQICAIVLSFRGGECADIFRQHECLFSKVLLSKDLIMAAAVLNSDTSLNNNSELDEARLLRRTEVCALLRICKSTFYKYLNQGVYPEPVYLADRAPRWHLTEIQELAQVGIQRPIDRRSRGRRGADTADRPRRSRG